MSLEPTEKITLTREEDGWVAIDEDTSVAGQGRTREEALRMLDEAVALHRGDTGEPIEDEDEFLRDLGIDSEEITEGASSPPWLEQMGDATD